MRNLARLVVALTAITLFGACSRGGDDNRVIDLKITAGGCPSAVVAAKPGEQLRLRFSNESAQLYQVAGPEGGLEPIAVEPARTADASYFVPQGAASYSIACTSQDGTTSSITLDAIPHTAADASSTTMPPSPRADASPTDSGSIGTTLAVTLVEYTVTASVQHLPQGSVNIIATNTSSGQMHELNVLRLQPDGTLDPAGELAPIQPQQAAAIVVKLQPGTYRLACLIRIGESGSTVDHYQQGMWTDVVIGG